MDKTDKPENANFLLWFRCENNYSFAEEAGFSMITRDSSTIDDAHTINIGNKRILRTASIYGANASGKSNLFNALSDMFHNIRGSRQRLLGRPFIFDAKQKDKSVSSEIVFCLSEASGECTEYRYGYSLIYNKEKGFCDCVESEWLTKRSFGSNDNFENVFVREGLVLTSLITSDAKTTNDLTAMWGISKAEDKTEIANEIEKRKRTLFLTWLSEKVFLHHPESIVQNLNLNTFIASIQRIHKWCVSSAPPYLFSDDEMKWQLKATAAKIAMADAAEIVGRDFASEDIRAFLGKDKTENDINEAKLFKSDFTDFLKKFDTCIKGVEIVVPDLYKGLLKLEDIDENHLRVRTFGVSEESLGKLDETLILKQSFGTRKIASVYRFFWEAWRKGGLIMVDELDTKLHPAVLRELVACFHSNKEMYKGQLVYSTHNCITLPKIKHKIKPDEKGYYMHPDEVYFTTKQSEDDHNPGYSTIERLVEREYANTMDNVEMSKLKDCVSIIERLSERTINDEESLELQSCISSINGLVENYSAVIRANKQEDYRERYESGDYGTSPDYFKLARRSDYE